LGKDAPREGDGVGEGANAEEGNLKGVGGCWGWEVGVGIDIAEW
jgi:hypothetical protein